MSISIEKIAKINPNDVNFTEPVLRIDESAVKWNENIRYFTYFSIGLGIVNIIILLINWKKFKNNILLLIFSIISIIFQWISMWINTQSNVELYGISQQGSIEFIMKFIFFIIPFIIQIIIFIKLIINIRKNKKEGGKL